MTVIDAVFLLCLSAVSVWEAGPFTVTRRGRTIRALVLVFLAVVQGVAEGFTWQFLPGYFLVVAAGIAAARTNPPRQRAKRLLGPLGWASGLAAALIPWAIFLPVPGLTPPEGPHAVGTQIYRWVDETRAEEATSTPEDRRNVIVQAWYPAAPGSQGDRLPYLDGLNQLSEPVGFLPGFLLGRYGQTETHGRTGVSVSDARSSWPVLIFLTGYGGVRGVYTSLAAGLASWGFVVLAVDHPYEAAVAELADGTMARTVERFEPDDPDRTAFMAGRLGLRVADVRFVLDQLSHPGLLGPEWEGRIDQGRIGVLGHSLGGAAAAAAMATDRRITGAVNLDGTFYGPIPGEPARRPFLVIESDRNITGHSERYREGNRALAAFFGGAPQEIELEGTSHYSFTDLELFFGPLGRLLWQGMTGTSRDPAEVHRTTVRLVRDFFWRSLPNG